MIIESLSLEHFHYNDYRIPQSRKFSLQWLQNPLVSVILITMITESFDSVILISMITESYGKCNSYYNDYRILWLV